MSNPSTSSVAVFVRIIHILRLATFDFLIPRDFGNYFKSLQIKNMISNLVRDRQQSKKV